MENYMETILSRVLTVKDQRCRVMVRGLWIALGVGLRLRSGLEGLV